MTAPSPIPRCPRCGKGVALLGRMCALCLFAKVDHLEAEVRRLKGEIERRKQEQWIIGAQAAGIVERCAGDEG